MKLSVLGLSMRTYTWILLLAGGLLSEPVLAVELAPGDIVLFSESPCGIYRLDPLSLAPTQISGCLGFGSEYHHLAVDRRGRLFVTDEVRGIVEVSPQTGARYVFMPVETLEGPPRGIAVDADGAILVTLQTAPPRLVRIDPEGRALSVVAEGGFLLAPTGVDVTPDGSILVVDQSGALVRLDPISGEQTRVATDPLYEAPQDLAWVRGDSVWIVNRGFGLNTGEGSITITRLSDGMTDQTPFSSTYSRGVALLPDGRIAYSGCNAIHGSCSYQYVAISDGISLSDFMGSLAVVPQRDTPPSAMLAPAVPNPFHDQTALTFNLARGGFAELGIFSVTGQRLVTLARGERSAGRHRLVWDGTDAGGRIQPPGVYYARLTSAEGRHSRMLVRIR